MKVKPTKVQLGPRPTPIPATCSHLPVVGGVAQPWANVHLRDGGVDFRSHHHARWLAAWTDHLCQVCGTALIHPIVLMGGPNQLRTLLFDEPPLHPECAAYVSRACPMVAGERTHYATGDSVANRSRGAVCFDPDCDCGGWSQHPGTGGDGKAGQPAVPYYAVYVTGYRLAASSVDPSAITGGICHPDEVLAVRHVSDPGGGRVWRRLANPLADYEPPQLLSPEAAR